jgi:serine protease Do
MRNKKQKTLRVTIEKLEENTAARIKAGSKPGRLVDDRLAVEIAELTQQQREQYDVEKGGVIVVTVEKGAAAKAGLRRGDVVVSLNNLQITSAKQFLDIARDLPRNKAIPVLVQRQQGAIFLALKIEKE